MKGKNTTKVLLAIINAYYDENNGFSHCSVNEINSKFGIALKNIPEMFRQLESEGWIEDCTVSGHYKRLKILKPYRCPKFILLESLNNSQKNYLLKCIELNINKDLSKKEICRKIHNSENLSNLNRNFKKIEEDCGKSVFELIDENEYLSGLIPENSKLTEFGYKTSIKREDNIKDLDISSKIINFLYSKSYDGSKHRKNIKEYSLTHDDIKDQLIKQEYKDYYTGIIPNDYKEYSIDRIDSSKGYSRDNIVITTNTINTMKNDLTTEEFKKQIKLLYNNLSNF